MSVVTGALFIFGQPDQYFYNNAFKVKVVCLLLLGLNYLIAIVVTGLLAWFLIARFGLFDGLTWILAVTGLLSIAGFYHVAKSTYIWMMWVTGFVYND